MFVGFFKQIGYRTGLGYICLDGDGLASEFLDGLHNDIRRWGGGGVVNNNISTTNCQFKGILSAHASTGPCDKGNLAVEAGGWSWGRHIEILSMLAGTKWQPDRD